MLFWYQGAVLEFPRHGGVRRDMAGSYTCTAYNDLGNLRASVRLTVVYAPSCRLKKVSMKSFYFLSC